MDWQPDTCDCLLDIDVSNASGNEVITISRVKIACRFHRNNPNKESHLLNVLMENRSKNRGLQAIETLKSSKGLLANNIDWRIDDSRDVYFKIKSRLPIKRDQDDVIAELGRTAPNLKIE